MEAKSHVELLIPVGDWESLKAAVHNGADAIYLGGQRFNARSNAVNFDNKRLADALKYAKFYGVSTYITVNTLIKEKELDDAMEFVDFIYRNGADAVIVQDLGIARLIKELYPDLPLHGSTQMTIHNLEGVRLLEQSGFKRVVLARELNLDEIKYISENTGIQLECFIHGALCVSYSGQCLMSSILGGRSGNRGMCAQPCRFPYRLGATESLKARAMKASYLLSTKDLSAHSFLSRVVGAGVSSLKVEGRMKGPEYVAVVTRAYRQLLDALGKAHEKSVSDEQGMKLLQVFNRGGFSSGYYFGIDNSNLINPARPGHSGIYIGKITGVARGWVDIALENELNLGDGIEFKAEKAVNTGQKVSVLKVGKKLVEAAFPGQTASIKAAHINRLMPGMQVWKTSSRKLLESARTSFEKDYSKKIPISIKGAFRLNGFPVIEFKDEGGKVGRAKGKVIVQTALKRPVSKDQLEAQLLKLGDTPFTCTSIELETDENIYLPVSAINELRRLAAAHLIENRTYNQRMNSRKTSYNAGKSLISEPNNKYEGMPEKPELFIYSNKLFYYSPIIDKIDGFCYMPDKWPLRGGHIKPLVEDIRSRGKKIRLCLPVISRREDMDVLAGMDEGVWSLFDSCQVANLGQVQFLKDRGVNSIIGEYSFNVFNSHSIIFLQALGLKGIVLSPELQIHEISDIINNTGLYTEVTVFGRIPLMLMEYCPVGQPYKNCSQCELEKGILLVDRMGMKFPIRKRGIARCYSCILNSQPLLLVQDLVNVQKTGVNAYGLRVEEYNQRDIEDIVSLYRFLIDYPDSDIPLEHQAVIDRIKGMGFTRGHFFRGVY